MNRSFALILIAVFASLTAFSAAIPDDSIEYYLERIPYYRGELRRTIDSLDHVVITQSPSYESIEASRRLTQLYLSINSDSALCFEELARRQASELGNDSLELILRMRALSLMPPCGMVHEAIIGLNAIDRTKLGPVQKREYYDAMLNTYLKAAYFYPPGIHRTRMNEHAIEALDSMLAMENPSHSRYRFLQSQRYQLMGDYEMASAGFAEGMEYFRHVPSIYDFCADALTKYYAERYGFDGRSAEWLIRRVINDIRHGVPAGRSMMQLGDYLRSTGNQRLAQKVFDAAGRVRGYRTDRLRHLEDDIMNGIPEGPPRGHHKIHVPIIFGAVSCLTLLVLIFLIWYLSRRNKETKAKAEHFETLYKDERMKANNVAASLLSVAMEAAEQGRSFNLLAERKLAASQSKDLYQSLSTGKIARMQTEAFLNAFDKAFLEAYPHFFEDLNTLLRDDAKIEIKADDGLTPEQRIAAFLRMGVSDSAQLAKTLGLSLNTVYTYRNRLKNRAIDRSTFESELHDID